MRWTTVVTSLSGYQTRLKQLPPADANCRFAEASKLCRLNPCWRLISCYAVQVPEGVANRFYALFGEQLKHAPDIAQGLGALSVLGADGEETSLHFADRSWFWKSRS